ncbi:hypothetical protein F3Y22_tig00110469pilonHSYRG00046 [Hibiscus syriacus]|uniref:Uncharacterized protein n=1 Tax=Hibiscus syriacus TaxID=106335 RepID=A0A6A3AH44_HIBSY|nr:hypothetical protein F3Y22_tig00110469pilonHSYRG00046 [Hibiscus syriacus]
MGSRRRQVALPPKTMQHPAVHRAKTQLTPTRPPPKSAATHPPLGQTTSFRLPSQYRGSRFRHGIELDIQYDILKGYRGPGVQFDLQGIRKRIRWSYMGLHEIFDEMNDKRMEVRASDPITRSGDLLDVLLDQCQESESHFTHQNIKPLILVLP